MPANEPKNAPATATTNDPNGLKNPGLVVRLRAFGLQGKRLSLWLVMTLLVTVALGSAANHFLSGGNKDQEAGVQGAAPPLPLPGAYGTWWNPAGGPSQSSDAGSSVSNGGNPSSESGSIIPVVRDAQFPSGSLTLNNPVTIGSPASQEAYAILGLRTSSSPALTTSAGAVTFSSRVSVVSFSLSGNLNLVPTDNLAAGGLTLAAVPEPSAGGMLAFGLAAVASARRRKPQPAA